MTETPPQKSQFTCVEIEDAENVVERLVRACSLREVVVKEADGITRIEKFGTHTQSRRADLVKGLMVAVNIGQVFGID
ncbi:MAG: hypothetical protein V9E94_19505 [Microthrixaceae bacterium]